MSEQRSLTDEVFIAAAKQSLDETAQQLDRRLVCRLERARGEALECRHRLRWPGWQKGLAAASVAFLVLILLVSRSEVDRPLQPMLEDLDVVTSAENADLSEDLEFYDWLADSLPAG